LSASALVALENDVANASGVGSQMCRREIFAKNAIKSLSECHATPLLNPRLALADAAVPLLGGQLMRPIVIVLLVVISITLPLGTNSSCQASDEDDFQAAIKGLSSTLGDDYKVDPYTRVAEVLQKMGKDKACRLLRSCTEQKDGRGVPVPNLCRLVFKVKKDSKFRRAMVGAVGFLGGTSYKDWPLDPFELVDGVPFVITDGSLVLAGEPESDKNYLDYCMKECEWNDVKFAPKTAAENEKALEKLLSSKKWQKPLTAAERDRLRAQIK
jgi:hypothetical protein